MVLHETQPLKGKSFNNSGELAASRFRSTKKKMTETTVSFGEGQGPTSVAAAHHSMVKVSPEKAAVLPGQRRSNSLANSKKVLKAVDRLSVPKHLK